MSDQNIITIHDQRETDRELCTACDGSGEGQHDGGRCTRCRGKGELPTDAELDEAQARREDQADAKIEEAK